MDKWQIVSDVLRERDRQDELKASGRFLYTCADLDLIETQRLAILLEEVGEVSRAVLNRLGLSSDPTYRTGPEDTRKELVQVMAVALAWIEAIDTEKSGQKAGISGA